MKSLTSIVSAIATGVLIVGSAHAQNEPPRPPEPPHRPDVPRPLPQMEKRAFLGVATTPVEPSLRAQLKLNEGFGLLVQHVADESPAADVIEPHDVLVMFGDQRLVNHDQLAALVRDAGKDADVSLTLMRGGEEQDVSITLMEKELPVHHRHTPLMGGVHIQPFDAGDIEIRVREMHKEMERRMQDAQKRGPQVRTEIHVEPGVSASASSSSSSDNKTMRRASWVEDGLKMDLTDDGKSKRLNIKRDGEEIFDGPIDSKEDRAKIPADVQDAVERMMNRLNGQPKPLHPDPARKDDVL